MDKHIIDTVFKNYDVRGLVDSQISEELMYRIGNAFTRHFNVTQIVVGRDGRKDSPRFQAALIQGMLDAGCNVVDVGVVSTPQLKWIVAHHKYPAGAMVTASHNPPQYNGVKFVGEAGLAIGEDAGLHAIKPLLDTPTKQDTGTRTTAQYLEEFVRFTVEQAGINSSEREVLVDGSGGVFSMEMKLLAAQGNFKFTFYNAELDPEFRVHPPGSTKPEGHPVRSGVLR